MSKFNSSKLIINISVLLLAFYGCNALGFEETEEVKSTFGIKAGIISSGNFDGAGWRANSGSSFSVGVFSDRSLRSYLSSGFNIDYHSISVSSERSEIIEFSISFKGVLSQEQSNFEFRPGLSAGLGLLRKLGNLENVPIFLVRGSIEFVFSSSNNVGFVFDMGVMGAPWEGINEEDVTMSFRPLIRLGVIL